VTGLYTVFRKELSDHFTSWRFLILFILILLFAVSALYVASQTIRDQISADSDFVFIRIFTTSGGQLPSFLWFIILFVPIIGIALGFDAINSEESSGTMSRLLSQPIYRDALINAKFLAGVVTIVVMLTSLVLMVCGLGLYRIGVWPTAEEGWRILFFLITTIIYGAFWMGLAILFSILFRRVATSALAAIAIWIFLYFFLAMIAGIASQRFAPAGDTLASQIQNFGFQLNIMRISPIMLFQEAMTVLLVPGMRTMEQMIQLQVGDTSHMISASLSLGQSLLTVWPHLVIIILLTVICFAISYVKFMREEIRSL
jgi:ABC-2 type transport system permease protein